MNRVLISAIIFSAVAFASADSFLYQGPGAAKGTATVHLSGVPGNTVDLTVYIGENLFTYGLEAQNYGYCVDLQSAAGNGQATKGDTSNLTGGGAIGYLLNKYAPTFHTTTNKQGAAALQLAIWDLLYENDPGNFQVTNGYNFTMNSGHFTATNIKIDGSSYDPTAYLAMFQADLGQNGTATVYRGAAGSIQSFASPNPVPEPATLAALAVGAAGMLRRRKRK